MRINNNLAALNAWRNLSVNSDNMQKSLERLSSGYRINRAADDAAGLAVSEKMKAQIRGLNMALRNAQDGISLLQTAEGGAGKIQDMLQRMRELAVQASNGTLTNDDRGQLQEEFAQLKAEIQRTASATTFNTISLISGDSTGNNVKISLQIGPGYDESSDNAVNTVEFELQALTPEKLGIDDLAIAPEGESASDPDFANVIETLDGALATVTKARAQMGAYQNRLESTVSTLETQYENLTAAESRIRDVDMAQEMANFTKYQILQQAGTAMLAQANQLPQSILSLLR